MYTCIFFPVSRQQRQRNSVIESHVPRNYIVKQLTMDEHTLEESRATSTQQQHMIQYHQRSCVFLYRNCRWLAVLGFFRNTYSAVGWLGRFMEDPGKDPQWAPEPYEGQYMFLAIYWSFVGVTVARAGYLSPAHKEGGDRNMSRIFLAGEVMTSLCIFVGFALCLSFILAGEQLCDDCKEIFRNSSQCVIHQKYCQPSCGAQALSQSSGRKLIEKSFCAAPWSGFYIWWSTGEFVVSIVLGVLVVVNAFFLEKHLNKLDSLNVVQSSRQRFETAMSAINIRDSSQQQQQHIEEHIEEGRRRPSIPTPAIGTAVRVMPVTNFGCLPEAQAVLVE